MAKWIRQFLRDEDGQDIVEYSLLITFIAIACMWFLGAGAPSVNRIWQVGNAQVALANTKAAS